MTCSKLPRPLPKFLRREEGGLSVETVIIFPALLFFFAAAVIWFDAFRVQNTNLKAAYTVADMVSRETLPLSDNYFEGMTDIFDYMAPSPDGSVLRVSMVKCTEACDSDAHRQLELCWSWAGSGKTSLTNEDLANGFDELVPIMPKGDTVIMAETFMVYEPAFEVGLGTINFDNVVLTRPRFAPQLLYGNEACF